jgi:methylated-DNA-[protein]-cysteine S-methyltransferase
MTEIERALKRSAPPADATAAAAASRNMVERATASGLVDLAYAVVPSPVGELATVCSRRGLMCLSYDAERVDLLLDMLAEQVSPRIVESRARFESVERQLDEYFAGRREYFDLPLDWSLTRGFHRRVLRATARIPYGQAATYGDMAARAGSPRAVRAAGNALGRNPIPIIVPCHRVLRTGGGLGGYGGGLDRKRYLLDLESGMQTLTPASD